ncbi:MAG: hypothetical protein M3N53_06295 [Actinomycetota bacterium]|nr:hypothetical protein [Actinomycetota bacterium]
MKKFRRVVCWLVIGTSLVACENRSPDPKPSVSSPPTPVAHGAAVVYVVSGHLMTTDPRANERRDLTPPQLADVYSPRWSPDGERIVFVCTPRSTMGQEICVIARDGSGFAQLTDTPEDEFSPDWSPDGRWIAFQGATSIEVMRVDGQGRRPVPRTANSGELGWRDASRIVYVGGSRDGGDIYTIRADGRGKRRLTRPHEGEEGHPRWGPRGDWIGFQRTTELGVFDLFTRRRDGSRVRRLTRPQQDHQVVRQVATHGDVFGDGQNLWLVRRDGGGLRAELKVGSINMESPDWTGR